MACSITVRVRRGMSLQNGMWHEQQLFDAAHSVVLMLLHGYVV